MMSTLSKTTKLITINKLQDDSETSKDLKKNKNKNESHEIKLSVDRALLKRILRLERTLSRMACVCKRMKNMGKIKRGPRGPRGRRGPQG